jgi:hypothetical protein
MAVYHKWLRIYDIMIWQAFHNSPKQLGGARQIDFEIVKNNDADE